MDNIETRWNGLNYWFVKYIIYYIKQQHGNNTSGVKMRSIDVEVTLEKQSIQRSGELECPIQKQKNQLAYFVVSKDHYYLLDLLYERQKEKVET